MRLSLVPASPGHRQIEARRLLRMQPQIRGQNCFSTSSSRRHRPCHCRCRRLPTPLSSLAPAPDDIIASVDFAVQIVVAGKYLLSDKAATKVASPYSEVAVIDDAVFVAIGHQVGGRIERIAPQPIVGGIDQCRYDRSRLAFASRVAVESRCRRLGLTRYRPPTPGSKKQR